MNLPKMVKQINPDKVAEAMMLYINLDRMFKREIEEAQELVERHRVNPVGEPN